METLRIFPIAEEKLNELVSSGVISADGANLIRIALDPFHDKEVDFKGWPDEETAPSVARKVNQQALLVSPFGVGVLWDCVIVMDSLLDSKYFGPSTGRTNQTATWANGAISLYGGCSAWAVRSGSPFLPFAPSANCVFLTSLGTASPFTDGLGRLLSAGYEVTNVTAPLYRQGAVTAFLQPQTQRDPVNFKLQSGANNADVSVTLLRTLPTTLADMMILTQSKTWKAEDGIYQVARFSSAENPPYLPSYDVPVYCTQDDQEEVVANTGIEIPQMTPGAIANTLTPYPVLLHRVHTSGSWFSGLSEQTSLQLNFRYYYESFPGKSQLDILPLARPSPSPDPRALRVLAEALRFAPVGVPVAQNGLGEWFADLIDVVSPILSLIPHPVAQAVGTFAPAVSKLIRPKNKNKAVKPAPISAPVNNLALQTGRRSTIKGGPKIEGPLTEAAARKRQKRRVKKLTQPA